MICDKIKDCKKSVNHSKKILVDRKGEKLNISLTIS